MDESSLGRPVETNDPSADEYLGLTISVESVIKGAPIAEVLLAWDAYVSRCRRTSASRPT